MPGLAGEACFTLCLPFVMLCKGEIAGKGFPSVAYSNRQRDPLPNVLTCTRVATTTTTTVTTTLHYSQRWPIVTTAHGTKEISEERKKERGRPFPRRALFPCFDSRGNNGRRRRRKKRAISEITSVIRTSGKYALSIRLCLRGRSRHGDAASDPSGRSAVYLNPRHVS